jgi:hypothetical protein
VLKFKKKSSGAKGLKFKTESDALCSECCTECKLQIVIRQISCFGVQSLTKYTRYSMSRSGTSSDMQCNPYQNNLSVITHDAIPLQLIWMSRLRQHTYHATPRFGFPSQLHISSPLPSPALLVRNKFPSTSRRIQMRQRLMAPLLCVSASNLFTVRITELQHVAWSHSDDYYTDHRDSRLMLKYKGEIHFESYCTIRIS